mgnify:CR=1 FL=1
MHIQTPQDSLRSLHTPQTILWSLIFNLSSTRSVEAFPDSSSKFFIQP